MKRRSLLQLTGASALSPRLPYQSAPEIIVIGAGAFGSTLPIGYWARAENPNSIRHSR